MISSLLHLVGLRPRVYYTLINLGGGGGGQGPLGPPPQYANEYSKKFYIDTLSLNWIILLNVKDSLHFASAILPIHAVHIFRLFLELITILKSDIKDRRITHFVKYSYKKIIFFVNTQQSINQSIKL